MDFKINEKLLAENKKLTVAVENLNQTLNFKNDVINLQKLKIEQLRKQLVFGPQVFYKNEKDSQLWICDCCKHELVGVEDGDGQPLRDNPKYCPNCGGRICYVNKVDT